MQSSTRRLRLRKLTSPAHASLDQLIGEFGSHADYERYVLGIHAFRIPLEDRLAATNWPEVFGDWRPQLMGQELRADIADLGLTPLARADRLQLPDTIENLLGQLYVLEGSALGAQILYRRAQNIGLSQVCGARHLALQSAAPDQWRKFLAILERATPVDLPGVAAASNAVFEAARQAFREFDDVDRRSG